MTRVHSSVTFQNDWTWYPTSKPKKKRGIMKPLEEILIIKNKRACFNSLGRMVIKTTNLQRKPPACG